MFLLGLITPAPSIDRCHNYLMVTTFLCSYISHFCPLMLITDVLLLPLCQCSPIQTLMSVNKQNILFVICWKQILVLSHKTILYTGGLVTKYREMSVNENICKKCPNNEFNKEKALDEYKWRLMLKLRSTPLCWCRLWCSRRGTFADPPLTRCCLVMDASCILTCSPHTQGD